MYKPAIVAVGYNRPEGMKRLLESIGKAKFEVSDVPLIVSIDESNRSDEVEQVARDFQWAHGTLEIRRFPERQGLRKHIVQCGDYSEKYGAVIILEDDLVVAEDFYTYVCRAHETYGDDPRVCGVSLYTFNTNQFTRYAFQPIPSVNDVFLGGMAVTWGQSWNKRQWQNFKQWYLAHEDKLPALNPKIPQDISSWTRSWGRYFASFMADQGLSYIYPYRARTTCFSDFGEHNMNAVLTFVQVPLMQGSPKHYHMGAYEELVHYDSFYEYVLDSRHTICGVSGDEICMDLSNMKTSAGGKKYVISNAELPHKKIASFALTMRPICMNVLEQIPGDQLHMYRLETDQIRPWKTKRPDYSVNHRRLKYEHYDASWRTTFFYGPREFFLRLRDVILEKLK